MWAAQALAHQAGRVAGEVRGEVSENLKMATHWATRSLRRRAAGEHVLTNAELARLFGSEWGLGVSEQGELELALDEAEREMREAAA